MVWRSAAWAPRGGCGHAAPPSGASGLFLHAVHATRGRDRHVADLRSRHGGAWLQHRSDHVQLRRSHWVQGRRGRHDVHRGQHAAARAPVSAAWGHPSGLPSGQPHSPPGTAPRSTAAAAQQRWSDAGHAAARSHISGGACNRRRACGGLCLCGCWATGQRCRCCCCCAAAVHARAAGTAQPHTAGARCAGCGSSSRRCSLSGSCGGAAGQVEQQQQGRGGAVRPRQPGGAAQQRGRRAHERGARGCCRRLAGRRSRARSRGPGQPARLKLAQAARWADCAPPR